MIMSAHSPGSQKTDTVGPGHLGHPYLYKQIGNQHELHKNLYQNNDYNNAYKNL